MKTIKLFFITIILSMNTSFSMVGSEKSDDEILMSFDEITKSSSSETLNPTLIDLTSSKSDFEELVEVFELERNREEKRKQIYKDLKEVFGE